jgi:hypothetical protein
MELLGVNPFHDLGKDRLAQMHGGILGKRNLKENAPELRSRS